jgi:RNA polymerase-binding transcription factor DksA
MRLQRYLDVVDRALEAGETPEELAAAIAARRLPFEIYDAIFMRLRICRRCGKEIPRNRRSDAAYCSEAHKKAGQRRRRAGLSEADGRGSRGVPFAGTRRRSEPPPLVVRVTVR